MSPRLAMIGRRCTEGDALPAWFSTGLFSVLVWCTTAGVSALVLLVENAYSPVVCSLIATALTAAAFPFRPKNRDGDRPAHGPALAAVAIALALFAIAGVSHSEHLFADRDPSVYINTGRSIARTHQVHPTIAPSPFSDTRTFTVASVGFGVASHRLVTNFLDFLPALLALGWSVGGDTGLLVVSALLGALALLALYALGSTVVGPRWALLGPAILTLAPLQSWFSRDAYAELPVELLALGGIWMFIAARKDASPVAAAIAGVVLGSITFVRIDALAIILAIPAALAVEYLRTESDEPRTRTRRRGAIWGFAIALGATVWAGLSVSRRISPNYLSDLQGQLGPLELGVLAGLVGALGILVVHQFLAGIGSRVARNRIVLGLGAALTVALALYAYHWRPRTDVPPTLTQPATAAARKAFNVYYQSASFRWFGWYLGVVTVALAVVGLIVLGIRAAHADSPAFILLAAAVPMTLLYVARPSVSPDQLWAMRRYVPIVLPAMTIAAGAAALWSTSAIGAWRPRLRAPSVALVVVAMLAPAYVAGRPFVSAQMQGGALDAVHEVCHAAGPDAAIAIEPTDLLAVELPQTLRGFCGVPAAGLKEHTTVPLADYAREWKDAGRQLYVASADPSVVLAATSNAVEVAHVVVADAREPERTVGRTPHINGPRQVALWLYRVDPI